MNCDDAELLLSGYLDNELAQQQEQHVRLHLDKCASCRQHYQQLRTMHGEIAGMRSVKVDAEQLDQLENEFLSKISRWSGFLFYGLGALVLVAIGFHDFITEFLRNPDIPIIERLASGGMLLGMLLLFLSVLRQRLISYKTDPYRNIKL